MLYWKKIYEILLDKSLKFLGSSIYEIEESWVNILAVYWMVDLAARIVVWGIVHITMAHIRVVIYTAISFVALVINATISFT